MGRLGLACRQLYGCHIEGPSAWGLTLCNWCLEILNFIFEFMLCKCSLMGHGVSVERGLGYGAVPSSRPLRTGSSLCALPSPAGSAPMGLPLSALPGNTVTLCPWSEPGCGCEKAGWACTLWHLEEGHGSSCPTQGWQCLGAFGGHLSTSDPGTCRIPLRRL